jgi:hypothetical protein
MTLDITNAAQLAAAAKDVGQLSGLASADIGSMTIPGARETAPMSTAGSGSPGVPGFVTCPELSVTMIGCDGGRTEPRRGG